MKYNKEKKHIIRDKILFEIKNNIFELICIIIIFLLGIIIGTICIKSLENTEKDELLNYINGFFLSLKNNKTIDYIGLLKETLVNNLILVFVIGVSGLSIIGMLLIYLIMLIKGFSIGYTISVIIMTLGNFEGIKFILIAMLINNIIIIPSLIYFSTCSLKISKKILRNSDENIKNEIFKFILKMILIAIIIILASFIETYLCGKLICIFYD